MILLSTQPYRGKCQGPESRQGTMPSSPPQYVQTGQRLVQFFQPPPKTWNEPLTDQNPCLSEQKSHQVPSWGCSPCPTTQLDREVASSQQVHNSPCNPHLHITEGKLRVGWMR